MAAPSSLNTVDRLIRYALRDAGRLQYGDNPNSEVISDCLGRLTDLINTWQTQGLKLWLNSIQSITLVAGTSTYVLGPSGAIITVKPTRVLQGWYVRSSGERQELQVLSADEFYSVGRLTQSGAVNSYYVDKQRLNLSVHFWQVPDATAALGTVELLIQQQALAPTTLYESLAFPVEWFLALRWGLADELASGQPALLADRCERKALMYRQLLEDWDVEDAPTRFTPDSQASGLSASRFR
jgi:hypothetical protein